MSSAEKQTVEEVRKEKRFIPLSISLLIFKVQCSVVVDAVCILTDELILANRYQNLLTGTEFVPKGRHEYPAI